MPVLAIDQGTTSTRALRVDNEGNASIVHSARHQQFFPESGRVEHDPEELIASIEACIDAAPDCDAIGIDNQGESCLAWDADSKQALSPVIVWQDNRSGPVIDRLKAEGHEPKVLEISGLPLDSYFSASKLAWIIKHNETAQKRLQDGKLRLGTTDAFFLDRLAGRFVTDITTASRTSLLNLESGQWDPDLCALFEVPMECLPEIVATTGDLGSIKRGDKHIPVTASVVDQQASLYGHGCRQPGDAKITFGTGAFALSITGDQPLRSPEQGLLPTVAWQYATTAPTYALDGGVYNAGSAIDWARQLGLFQDYADINQFSAASAISRELAFVPALSGLACPHWDRSAAGAWIGMSLETSATDLVQAVIEGVAFRAGEVISAMGDFVNIGDRISVDGGVSVNPYFCQFLADILKREVAVKPMAELTAMGTAALAGAVDIQDTGQEESMKVYEPKTDSAEQTELFAEAVKRATGWRRSALS